MNTAFRLFKPGTKCVDLWFDDWGIGTVTKRTRTRLFVRFSVHGETRWDVPHVRAFLRKL